MNNELSGESVTININKKDDTESQQTWKVGDEGIMLKDMNKVMELQVNHGGWVDSMKDALGKSMKVIKVWDDCDLQVTYGSKKWTLNKACLMRKDRKVINDLVGKDKTEKDVKFKPGDEIKIIGDKEKANELQKDHGGWSSGMELYLNKTGNVISIFPNGDLRVKVLGTKLTFNPKCCQKIADKNKKEISEIGINDDDDDNSSSTDRNSVELMTGSIEKLEFIMAINIGDGTKVEKLIGLVKRDEKFEHFTAAHLAVSEGHDHIIRILTNNQYKFDIGDKDGDTALHIAVTKNRNNCVLAILESGTDPNQENNYGMTPLMLAVIVGYKDILQSLLNSTKIKINFRSEKCGTALHVAIKQGRSEEALMLIDSGANLTALDENKFPALHLAAIVGSERILKMILEKGPPGLVDSQKEDGFAAVHVCAINNRLSCMKLLIDKNADLNIRTSIKQTALHIAVSQKHFDMVKLLVENKADPNLKDQTGDTPLHDAIIAYSVDQITDEGGILGLARLLQNSSKGPGKLDEIAVYLAQNGARLDIKNLIGQTPIDVCNNSSLQRKLIEILNPTKSKPIQLSMPPPKNELKKEIDDDVKDKSVKSEDEMICKICFANKADMAFGCGHMCCQNCANNIMNCHVCRNKIVTRLKLYNH